MEQTQSDVSVNTIAGSNKKRRKMMSEQEVEESDDESIHTSDISTDEEDSGVISDDEKEHSGERTLVKVENSGTDSIEKEDDSCYKCELNRGTDNEAKEKQNDKSGKVVDSNVGNSGAKENVTIVKTKHHARGTSGKWTVSEIRPKKDEVTNDNKKVEKDSKVNKSDTEKPTDKVKTVESIKPEETVIKSEEAVTKKVVNIPVEREKHIQVRMLFKNFFLP
jgi:hypothetical protein